MRIALFLLLIGLILSSIKQPLNAQQILLEGQVSIHNSLYETGKIQYVSSAFANAPFADSDETDVEGRFGLTFVGMDKGTEVKVSVEKSGLELVNTYELERVIIGRKPLLRVYLTEKGKLAKAQTELYNISKKALFAEKNAIIARLQGSKQEQKAALQELENKLSIEIADAATAIELLENKITSIEKRLPEFAQKMAVVNLDFASDLYIKAYEQFKTGDIEGAILELDDAELEGSYQSAVSTIAAGKKLQETGKEIEDKGLLQVDQIVESYQLKAASYKLLFQYRLATESYERAVQILKETTGEQTAKLADTYGVLAMTYRDLGEYKKALDALLEALAIKEQIYHDNHPQIAVSYNNLALILQELGDYKNALLAQQKDIIIREQAYGIQHPSLATSYNNLATIYQDLGLYEDALLAQRKDIAIREQIYEAKHPSIATSYNNLALIYQNLEDYESALIAQEKSLAIKKEIYDTNHPSIATSYNNLALIYQDLELYEKALLNQQKALLIREQIYEAKHPLLGISYTNMGSILFLTEDYKQAKSYFNKALSIFKEKLGTDHPNTQLVQSWLDEMD